SFAQRSAAPGRRRPPAAQGCASCRSAPPTATCRTASGARHDSDGAGNTGTAEPAVAAWILAEVLLVIVLGVIERRRRTDLGRDSTVAFLVKRLLEGILRPLRRLELPVAVGINGRAVLRAGVVALAHPLRRIVTFPEDFEQFFVAHHFRIEDDEHYLGMVGETAAHFLVGRILGITARVTDRCAVDARALPEKAFGAPEAAHAEHRLLETGGKRRLQRMAVHEMLRRNAHRLVAAGQRALGWNQLARFLHEGKHGRTPCFLE